MMDDIDINNLKGLIPDNTIKLYELSSIKSLATCPSLTVQNVNKTITLSPSGGVPPYTLELIIDNISVRVLSGITGLTTMSYNFPQSIGSHTINARVTDSCIPPQVTNSPVCTLDIIAPSTCPSLSVILTI